MPDQPLLIVVHPGSLCGSLDMHCPDSAEATRASIAAEITKWPGPVIVVDGDLTDELAFGRYRKLGRAVDSVLYRTFGAATDLGLERAAQRCVKKFQMKPGTPITVTGAWADRNSGCVTTVVDALLALGLTAQASPHAPASD